MTDIQITPLQGGRFGVRVAEGDTATDHVVTVTPNLLEELGTSDADSELVVRESFRFLLERELATSILREFSLRQISDYFPAYVEELRTRLGR